LLIVPINFPYFSGYNIVSFTYDTIQQAILFKNHEHDLEIWLTKNNRYDLFSVYKLICSCKLDGIFFDEKYAYILKKASCNTGTKFRIIKQNKQQHQKLYKKLLHIYR
jgi:hypothetical protein